MSQSSSTIEKKLQSELDALKNTQKGKLFNIDWSFRV